jgi:hypothetical protein
MTEGYTPVFAGQVLVAPSSPPPPRVDFLADVEARRREERQAIAGAMAIAERRRAQAGRAA